MEKKVLPLHASQDEFLHISPEGLNKLTASFDPTEPLRNTVWTTDHSVELPIHIKKEGPGIAVYFHLLIFKVLKSPLHSLT